MPFIKRKDHHIYYRTEGEGEPLVFLHSLGTNHNIWKHQIEAFKHVYQVITLDFNGHGDSDATHPFSISEAANDVLALLDVLNIDSAHIAGISLGGHVSMELFTLSPKRVRSLILADTWCYMEPSLRVERTEKRIGRLNKIGLTLFFKEIARGSLSPHASEQDIENLFQTFSCSEQIYQSAWHAVHAVDYRHALQKINIPTLVLVGDEDQSSPLPYSEDIAAKIEGAQLHVIPNGGHLSHLTNPAFFNQCIYAFLK